MSQVTSSLLNGEVKRKSSNSSNSEALVVKRRGRDRSRTPHVRDQSRDSSKGDSKSKKDIECHYCHKKGHMKKECWKLKAKNSKKGEERKKEDASVVTSGDEMLVVCDDNSVNFTCQDSNWVVDSGASFHVTSHADFFNSYTKGDFGYVRMGNEGVSQIVGMGDICLKTYIGCKLLLKDVRHVPNIRLNLISTGKLDDEGYNNQFGDGKWKLSKNSLVVARDKKISTLYWMQGKIYLNVVNTLENDSSIKLWHKWLGHISEKGLQVLAKKELLPGLKGMSLKIVFIA